MQSRLERDHWWYAARRRIVRTLLGPVPAGSTVLDAGSGPGGNRSILPDDVHCIALDPSAHSLALSREHDYVGWLQGDLLQLPLRDASVDLVLAMDVFEHLDEDARAAREILRVLKPGGRLLVTVPAFQWLWGLQDRLSHHRRRYTRPELLKVLAEAGFKTERSTYFNTILLPLIWVGRRILDVIPHRLESEGQITLPLVNAVLRWTFGMERHWLRRRNLPVGVSIYCLAHRDPAP